MRRILLFSVVLVSGLLFTGRLFYLQILNTSYAGLSENNAIKRTFDYPQRGHIYDRDGELLVSNQPSYDVMVIPREVEPFDTLELCQMLKMTKDALVTRLEKARVYSPGTQQRLHRRWRPGGCWQRARGGDLSQWLGHRRETHAHACESLHELYGRRGNLSLRE